MPRLTPRSSGPGARDARTPAADRDRWAAEIAVGSNWKLRAVMCLTKVVQQRYQKEVTYDRFFI
jgi:hypothetical protein